MSVEDVGALIDALPELESVALQVNGEPLVYPRLAEVIRLLKANRIRVELNTNGILLASRAGTQLIEAELDQLNISVDGMKAATYTQLRGLDGLDRVIDNARAFMRQRGPGPNLPRVSLWMTISQHNLDQLSALVAFAAEIQAEEVYVQRLVHYGEGFAREQDSLHGRLTEAQRDILESTKSEAKRLGVTLRASGGHDPVDMLSSSPSPEPWRHCRRPHESAVVMANGEVVPCCISTFVGNPKDIRMGSLRDQQVENIWQGSRYQAMREALAKGTGPEFCRQCGIAWSL